MRIRQRLPECEFVRAGGATHSNGDHRRGGVQESRLRCLEASFLLGRGSEAEVAVVRDGEFAVAVALLKLQEILVLLGGAEKMA